MNALRKFFAASIQWPLTQPVARLVLGGVLVVAGALKVGDPAAMVRSVRNYQIEFMPDDVARLIGYTLPTLEIVVGVLLILGLATRLSAWIGGILMILFTVGIAYVWKEGIAIDCGCFGSGGEIGKAEAFAKYPWEIARDIGLAILAGLIIWGPASRWSLDYMLGLVMPEDLPGAQHNDDEPLD